MPAVSLSSLLPSVDFSTTTVAVLAVAAVLVVVYVTIKACIMVLELLGGQVFYGGRFWDRDVMEIALREVKQESRRGSLVDAESRRAVDAFEGRKSRSSAQKLSTRV